MPPGETLLQRYAASRLGPADAEVLRLVLRADSVIDWKRLYFKDRGEVTQFLRVNLLDPDDPADERRMRAILQKSVDYLRDTFRYKVADAVAAPRELHDLFLLASGALEPRKLRRIACVVLKVMHTVHHVEARELLHRARVSEVEIAQMVDLRVREAVDRLRSEHELPVLNFEGNTKSRESIITKLLAKREHVAAQVYDRHRYRLVVHHPDDVVPSVLALAHELFPFNYVIPGQTQNTLISLADLVEKSPGAAEASHHWHDDHDETRRTLNQFSGRSYRILNFIVDLPLRIDATALATRRERDDDLGRIVFAPVELQVVDSETSEQNEAGDNSHVRYKKRQLRRVLSRLSRGLVVPKKRLRGPKPPAGGNA